MQEPAFNVPTCDAAASPSQLTGKPRQPPTVSTPYRQQGSDRHVRKQREGESEHRPERRRPVAFEPRPRRNVLEGEAKDSARGEPHDGAQNGVVTTEQEPPHDAAHRAPFESSEARTAVSSARSAQDRDDVTLARTTAHPCAVD